MDSYNANWNYPTNILVGIGRISELPKVCTELQITRPLLVTDPTLATHKMVLSAAEHCNKQGLICHIFSHITANPTDKNINDGVETYKSGKHNGVIAIGGGSAIDAAKAIALMVGQSDVIWQYEDLGNNWQKINADTIAPVIAIPTTSGTGAEVGRVAVITDPKNKMKRLIFHPKMLPDTVILDPKLTLDLPPSITAATGMDALSHALEAYCAPGFHPMAQGIALKAIKSIKDNLITAYKNPQDLNARTHMMVASTMAATAFQKGLGAMHALAHPIGALYGSHHGLLNAILMPYVLIANRHAISDSIKELSQFLNLPQHDIDSFIEWVLDLRAKLDIPHTLAAIHIDSQFADKIANMAVADPSALTNPILLTEHEYKSIFNHAVNGIL